MTIIYDKARYEKLFRKLDLIKLQNLHYQSN